jgi:arginase family enzyme
VLKRGEIETDFGNGGLSLKDLLEILKFVKSNKNIISADICGYSKSRKKPDKKSIESYLAVAKEFVS